MRFKYFSFLFILFIFCSSNPYEEELTLNSDALFTEISNFEDIDRDLDLSLIHI